MWFIKKALSCWIQFFNLRQFVYNISFVLEQITRRMHQFKKNSMSALLAFWESLPLDYDGFVGQSVGRMHHPINARHRNNRPSFI